jgi:chromosome transmission fidelity protein 1
VDILRVDGPSRLNGGARNDEEEITCTKIYYASRTHSQLAQVLPELSKLMFSLKPEIKSYHPASGHVPQKRGSIDGDQEEENAAPVTRAVSLGSRKQLCINDELRSKTRDLDEACRELLGGMLPLLFLQPLADPFFREKRKTMSVFAAHRRR